MKLDKIQIELLKAVMKDPERVSVCECEDDDFILVTADNMVVYCLEKERLRVNLFGLNYSTTLCQLDEMSGFPLMTSNELVPTDTYRKGGDARKYLYAGDANRPYYVSQKLLANFPGCRLFQERYNKKGPAVIVEPSNGLEVVGWIMPVNVKEDDTEAEDEWTE